jgi:hypothetical protein
MSEKCGRYRVSQFVGLKSLDSSNGPFATVSCMRKAQRVRARDSELYLARSPAPTLLLAMCRRYLRQH